MGKMRGNRLNTAANVGSFVTGRQQLNVQRTLAQQNAVQAELAAVQLDALNRKQLSDEHQRMLQWAAAAIAAGQLSQADADNHVAAHMHNLTTPEPQAAARITARFSEFLVAGINAGGPRKGWYKQGDGTARYWDGNVWTHHTTSMKVARKLVQQLSTDNYSGIRHEVDDFESSDVGRPTADVSEVLAVEPVPTPLAPLLPPAGWYPMGTPGILGYWDGRSWTGETRPDPSSFPG